MANVEPYSLSFWEILATSVAKMGPIPEHIAIIMDGNRRYARAKGLKTVLGHEAGSSVTTLLAQWVEAIGCKELTLYAFSSENFKRTEKEVEDVMDVIYRKVGLMIRAVDTGKNTSMCFQVIGNWDSIPLKLKFRLANLMQKTKNFKPYKLNVAVGYTGREGILRSLKEFEGQKSDKKMTNVNDSFEMIPPIKWNEYLLEQAQNLVDMRPVDMLIRTGGDLRLSDFMLWEASHAYVHFIPTTWPEFSFTDFIHAIFMYQLHRSRVPKRLSAKQSLSPEVMLLAEKMLQAGRTEKWAKIARLGKRDVPPETSEPDYVPNQFMKRFEALLNFN
ncbi:isoprenyl transferase [Folsomia candida]|uniref:Alkyl transferase n=1 Tax=Folsomia candida TaxID=158441 RepID=A0A226CVA2_FOLCA|nr:isoprenyl transferase [Folsomia candida]OXA36933.1 Dehydrodolichyl diphosphate syntase complex subunit DHDDS [Folsomia candida]